MFEASHMVKKKGRFIRAKTVCGMYSRRHYIFRQRLLAKAELVPGCTVIECDEPYSSKTCGACRFIHKNLGERKVFALLAQSASTGRTVTHPPRETSCSAT